MIGWQDKTPSELPLVVLDTETTGLSPALGHRVVELGAWRLEGLQPVAQLETLLNPGRPMDPGASAVNGIVDADLADAPSIADVWPALEALVDGAVIVAHNAAFDAGFLAAELAYAGSGATVDNPWLCTLQLARHFFFFGRNSLAHVATRLGVTYGRRHRALEDARITGEVFKRMLPLLARHRLHTIGDLLEAQGGPIFARPPAPPELPASLRAAVQQGRPVRIRYRTMTAETDRVITPLYASEQAGATYLVAYCHLREAQRTFRLDRLVSVEPVSGDEGAGA
jgi:DNA polymerase-3 subunit epsilon